jgi:hypothetical protein
MFLINTPGKVQSKMNKNATVYPEGFAVADNAWINLWNTNQNASLGWKGAMSGNGVQPFGAMLSNTQAFASCMAKRAFVESCKRQPADAEASQVSSLASDFISNQYNMRKLIEKAALIPACLGD